MSKEKCRLIYQMKWLNNSSINIIALLITACHASRGYSVDYDTFDTDDHYPYDDNNSSTNYYNTSMYNNDLNQDDGEYSHPDDRYEDIDNDNDNNFSTYNDSANQFGEKYPPHPNVGYGNENLDSLSSDSDSNNDPTSDLLTRAFEMAVEQAENMSPEEKAKIQKSQKIMS